MWAIAVVAGARLFRRARQQVKTYLPRIPVPLFFQPAIGMLLTGIIAIGVVGI